MVKVGMQWILSVNPLGKFKIMTVLYYLCPVPSRHCLKVIQYKIGSFCTFHTINNCLHTKYIHPKSIFCSFESCQKEELK